MPDTSDSLWNLRFLVEPYCGGGTRWRGHEWRWDMGRKVEEEEEEEGRSTEEGGRRRRRGRKMKEVKVTADEGEDNQEVAEEA